MNEVKTFNGSECANINLSVRERIAIRQALEDEIEILKKRKYLDEDKIKNRIIICEKALSKIKPSLTKKDYDGVRNE